MSALSRTCYWTSDLERWSDCDGHWFCRCTLPRDAAISARVLDYVRRKVLAHRFRLPAKYAVRAALWLERRIEAVRSSHGASGGGAK